MNPIIPIKPSLLEEVTETTKPKRRNMVYWVRWLIVLSLAMTIVPLALIASTIEEAAFIIQTDVTALAMTLAFTPAPDPTQEAMKAELSQLRADRNILEPLLTQLNTHYRPIPVVMGYIRNYDTTYLGLTGLTEANGQLTLTGQAYDEKFVMHYAEMLRSCDAFERVMVQAITLKTLETDGKSRQKNETALRFAAPVPSIYAEFVIVIEFKGQS